MRVVVTDSVGMTHEAEAALMGLCDEGHDCYMVVVPFLVDVAHPPEFDISQLDGDAHVRVVGLGINGETYGTAPFFATHKPAWPTRRDRIKHRLGRWVVRLGIIFESFYCVLNIFDGRWFWVITDGSTIIMLTIIARKLDRQRQEYQL